MGNTLELPDDKQRFRSDEQMDPYVGRLLMHYRIVERIGQGGMSVVYRGRDEHLERDVAVKVLHPFLAEKAECRARLAREARAVARLEHENILRIFDFSGDPITVDETSGKRYRPADDNSDGFLVTELVVGDTLKRYAERHNIWAVPEFGAVIVWQLANALSHAHAQGVVHRDLKPENVMVRRDGVVKLMDFGIAQIADTKSLTVTGTLLGSPAHMPPECIEGEPADEQSDIFSLGTVLYWLSTGRLPFEALTPHALLKAIVDGRSTPPQQANNRVSDALAAIIKKAMSRKRRDRYKNADEMRDALGKALHDIGLDLTPERAVTLLAAPKDTLPGFTAEVRLGTLNLVQTLLDAGSPAKALSVLGRVLAVSADDDAAKRLLERATGSMDGAGDERSEVVDDGFDERGNDVALAETVVPAGVPQRSRLLAGLALTLAIVFGVSIGFVARAPSSTTDDAVSANVGSATAFVAIDDDTASDGQSEVVAATSAAALPETTALSSVSSENPPTAMQASTASGDTKLRPRDISKSPVLALVADPQSVVSRNVKEIRENPRMGPTAPGTEAAKGKGVATGLATASDAGEELEIYIRPFATVFIDGTQIAEYARSVRTTLSHGKHRVRFVHPFALEHEVDVDVPDEGPLAPLRVQMTPKPAFLRIESNVNADVAVGWLGKGSAATVHQFKGTTSRSMRNAIRISLPDDWTAGPSPLEIVLSKVGFQTEILRQEIVAGETTTLKVVLQPVGDVPPGN